MSQETNGLWVRWAIRSDRRDIEALNRTCAGHGWTWNDIHACLRERDCIGMSVEEEGVVVGHMIYELHKHRLVVLHMASVGGRRGDLIRMAMLDRLKSKLSPYRRRSIRWDVEETRLDLQVLLRDCGFRAEAVLYGMEEWERDHYRMVYRLVARNAGCGDDEGDELEMSEEGGSC